MCEIENKILDITDTKPSLYARFVDDIFIEVRNEKHLIDLKNTFINESGLNFTHELSVNNKLPFLDVLLDNSIREKYL